MRLGRADQTGLEAGSLDVVMVRHVLAATNEDVRRWDKAFQAAEVAPAPATIFAPLFLALGRQPD